MCLRYISVFFLISLASLSVVIAQTYRPMNGPSVISGSFGEPRENHFHTGLDLTTQGKTGIAVYAFEDGYISRIKVSSIGYGKAVYIMHANGLMSVYAHLSSFGENIQQYVTKEQYRQQKFEVDLYPDKNLLKVTKGQVIAYSGNSGGSSAPHLHFEVRDASGESFPLNPLKYNLNIRDTIAPVFRKIAFYNTSGLIDIVAPKEMALYKVKDLYKIRNQSAPDTIRLPYTQTGIGIKAYDLANGCDSDGFFGIYSLQVTVDGKNIFEFDMNRLDFSEGRYANCLIDYQQKKRDKEQFYRCYLMPGNEASIYSNIASNGMIMLKKGEVRKVNITASDYFKNTCHAEFYLTTTTNGVVESAAPVGILLRWDEAASWKNQNVFISLDSKTLYEDLYLTLDSLAVPINALSKIYKIHNEYTPLHKSYRLSIKTSPIPKNIPSSKLIIVRQKQNGSISPYTSSYKDGMVSVEPKEFGNFYIVADTMPPTLTAHNLKNNQILQSKVLNFTLIDMLSGINTYNFFLDDKWILAEYDAKSDAIKIDLGNLSKGEHILKSVVTDKVLNNKTYTYKFTTL